VHQPSAEIFEMFDQVLFLSRGRIQYMGPRENAVDYFASIGHQCPVWENAVRTIDSPRGPSCRLAHIDAFFRPITF
jgi:ABC-type multidrug transport system ATPase subunit